MEGRDSGSVIHGTGSEAQGSPRPDSVEDSGLVGVPVVLAGDSPAEVGVETRRKRGRPRVAKTALRPPPLKRNRKEEEEEEDVCFICFDGGSLVLCDYKGCPKAYHTTCIKRDESYFKAKAKWHCGWHICSVCQKASHYMCYTCTYSLCKGCTRGANYRNVRGNKGFCSTCMKTIMLIENKDEGDKESVQVDFDDKSSWEYLFKVYWLYLKGRLSLTLNELMQAKSPWPEASTLYRTRQMPRVYPAATDGKGSSLEVFPQELPNKNQKQQLESPNHKLVGRQSSPVVRASVELEPQRPDKMVELTKKETRSIGGENSNVTTQDRCNEWVSKELLEFVGLMRNGDTSILSKLDFQALLLDYIKKNNLRDPHQKSQIICDSRLKSLLGRPRVGHTEMLKLLEDHFPIKKGNSQDTEFVPAGVVGTDSSQVEAEQSNGNAFMNKDKKHKTRGRCEDRPSQMNLDEYAAVDVHNIKLIYLSRNLMENLIKDKQNFHDMVVGSIVRIRLSTNDPKQDMYRLVQVVDTSKVAAGYKIGDQTVDVVLEILNLDKKEPVSIDSISSQEFSEEECRRLRMSIRCGIVKPFTIAEIQKKAVQLQLLKFNDWLEAEILHVRHLRDLASEKGCKREHREFVEKLELLQTPEERQRKLQEVPEVHADPKMSPNYKSDEESREYDGRAGGREVRQRSISTKSKRNVGKSISPRKKGNKRGSVRNRQKMSDHRDAHASINATISGADSRTDQNVVRCGSENATASLSSRNLMPSSNSETDKLWHYRDPSGKVQGPFSMEQLRMWNTTGLFPLDMRIWTNNELSDSLLLTDALSGRFDTTSNVLGSTRLLSQENGPVSENEDVRLRENTSEAERESKETGGCSDNNVMEAGSDVRAHANGNHESTRADGLNSSLLRILDLLEGNDSPSDQTEPRNSPASSSLAQASVASPQPGRDNESSELDSSQHNGDHDSQGDIMCRVEEIDKNNENNDKDLSSSEIYLRQSSEKNLQSSPLDLSINKADFCTGVASVAKSDEPSEQNGSTDIIDLHSPPKTSVEDGQCLELQLPLDRCVNKLDFSTGVASVAKFDDSSEKNGSTDIIDLQSPIPKTSIEDLDGQCLEMQLPLDRHVKKVDFFTGVASVAKSDDSSGENGSTDIIELQSPTPKTSIKNLDGRCLEMQLSLSSQFPVQGLHIPDLPPPTANPSNMDESGQVAETKQSVPSSFPVQDTGPNWNSASSLVIGGAPFLELGYEWGAHSPPQPNVPNWQALLDEPIEFSTLGEESVSDLLAEVDAMESRSGLASPTSTVKHGQEMTHCHRNDSFSSIEVLSPTTAKGGALNSTLDVQQSSLTGEPRGASQAIGFYPLKRSLEDPSESSEGETKSADSVVQAHEPHNASLEMDRTVGWSIGSESVDPSRGKVNVNMNLSLGGTAHETGQEAWPSAPHLSGQDMVGRTLARTVSSECMDPGWGKVQLNMNLSLGGPVHGGANVGWGPTPNAGSTWTNPNSNRSVTAAGQPWDGQRRYCGERFASPRDSTFPGGDTGHGRSRSSWSRQSYGGGGGGGYSRPHPKGQRICKFYESGRCRKGASCDYLHP